MQIKILENPSDDIIIENIKFGFPFKITNRMNKWPLINKWNINFFRRNYGNYKVTVKNLNLDFFFTIENWTLNKYLDYVENKNDKSLYYASDVLINSLSPELLNDYDMDFIKDIDVLRTYFNFIDFRWVFVGKKNTFTGLHCDIYNTSAWLGLISGKKRFYIYNESDSEKIREFGNLDGINIMELDQLLETFFDSLNPIIVDINPGEIIFTPSRWYHYVINLETSIALTENFCHTEIERNVRLELYKENDISTYFEFIFVTNTISCLLGLITVVLLLVSLFNFTFKTIINKKLLVRI